MDGDSRTGKITDIALLRSIAEQLKVPLTTIARQAELSELTGQPTDPTLLQLQTDIALSLVDSYLLGLTLAGQKELHLEPVSVSAVLTDIAHELSPLAAQHGITVELAIGGRYAPVMAHAQGLRAALLSLGYGVLYAQAAQARDVVTLALQRMPQGLVTGLYGIQPLSTGVWRQALRLHGRAQQPLASILTGSGAGVFIADALLRTMQSRLRVGKSRNSYGLATTLRESQQLRFV
ncbi:MAG TPA: hypothetical protein VFK47_21730 [Ktedonobacteraceae bacterium]|nr:hypothetical protein [Ktedonobacteraceae bacterium]